MGRSTSRTARRSTWALLGVAAVIAAACTDPVAAPAVASLSCSPPIDSVEVGLATTTLAFKAFDVAGREVSGTKFNFTSSASDVATIDAAGVATGVKVGNAVLTATAQGRSCNVTLRVVARVASLVVTPSPSDVSVGATRQLTASVFDAAGTAIAGRVVNWSTSNAGMAVVNPQGVVTGIAEGQVTITAAVGTKVATSSVRVTPEAVQSVRFLNPANGGVVVLRLTNSFQASANAYGSGPALNRTINWTSSNPTVAVVNANGLVNTLSIGTTTITAECEGKQANFTVQVTLVPVSTVSILPSSLTILRGNNQQLTVVARDSAGNALSLLNRAIFWNTSNSVVASVGGSGVVTAFTPGTADITVTVDGVPSPVMTVTVMDPPVVSVQVTPNSNTIKVGLNVLLSAVARDVNQNVIPGKTFTWITSDPSCATVTTNGLVNAVAVGTCTITATVDGISGTSIITVIP